jgi:tellurite resistance protein TehA-like permease
MEYALPILILIVMFGVLGVLALGVVNLARGNNPQRSQKLMRSRVLLQGLALVLFAIFMLLFRR